MNDAWVHVCISGMHIFVHIFVLCTCAVMESCSSFIRNSRICIRNLGLCMFIQTYHARPRVEDEAMMVSLNRPVSIHLSNGRCRRVYVCSRMHCRAVACLCLYGASVWSKCCVFVCMCVRTHTCVCWVLAVNLCVRVDAGPNGISSRSRLVGGEEGERCSRCWCWNEPRNMGCSRYLNPTKP